MNPTTPLAIAFLLAIAATFRWQLVSLRRVKRITECLRHSRISRISSLRSGLALVRGQVNPIDAPLTSPHSGTSCVLYELEVFEKRTVGSGDTAREEKKYWKTDEGACPCTISDKTGVLEVEFHDSELLDSSSFARDFPWRETGIKTGEIVKVLGNVAPSRPHNVIHALVVFKSDASILLRHYEREIRPLTNMLMGSVVFFAVLLASFWIPAGGAVAVISVVAFTLCLISHSAGVKKRQEDFDFDRSETASGASEFLQQLSVPSLRRVTCPMCSQQLEIPAVSDAPIFQCPHCEGQFTVDGSINVGQP